MGSVKGTGRHSMSPYFDSADNEYMSVEAPLAAAPGPNYPIDVPNNKFSRSGHMPFLMPQEEYFRPTYTEERQVVERDPGRSAAPTSYHHPDIGGSQQWGKNNNVTPRNRVASLTPGSLDERSQSIGPISYKKRPPWPTELESAYMPVIPDDTVLDDYYLPNERFPFLGQNRSYENDLFSPTEPEQAENPYASVPYFETVAYEATQVYVPYRSSMATSHYREPERPYSVSSYINSCYGHYGYDLGNQDFESGVMTPISNFSYPFDDTKNQHVARKPVPPPARASFYVRPRESENRVPPRSLSSIYSPPATPPAPSPAPPPVPPKRNISPVSTLGTATLHASIHDSENRVPPVQISVNHSRPMIPVDRPSVFIPNPGPVMVPRPIIPADRPSVYMANPGPIMIPGPIMVPVPNPVQVPKRKKWWKRLFSRSR